MSSPPPSQRALDKTSKEAASATVADGRKKIFLVSTIFNVFQWVIIVQSEPTLISKLSVDKARVGNFLGTTQGVAGALSFMLYPFLGKVMDAMGRKPGLLLAPVSNAITGMLVTMNPNSLFLVLLNRILRMLTISFSNTVMTQAALADFLSGSSLAVAFSRQKAATGLATVIAPQIETVILKLFKSPRYAYAVYTAVAMCHSIFHVLVTPETLEVAKRVSLDSVLKLRNLNPLKFMKLYTDGSVDLQKLATIYGFQMLGEGKNINDAGWTWTTEFLNWDVPTRNSYISLYGIEGICSGMFVAPRLVKMYSTRTFTTIANLSPGIGLLVQSVRRGWAYVLGLLLLLPGINGVNGTAISALAADLATAEGFGKGEFAGILGNFRSIAGIASPVLLGRYISWLKTKGLHHYVGSVFFVIALLSAATPELLHQSINYQKIRSRISKAH